MYRFAYQAIVKNNQMLMYSTFVMSEKYFTTLEVAKAYMYRNGPEFSAIELYKPSRLTRSYFPPHIWEKLVIEIWPEALE